MTSNPFILKEYIVYESNTDSSVSEIKKISEPAPNNHEKKGTYNILELQQYLSLEVNRFLIKARFANTCYKYIENGLSSPAECTNTFNTITTGNNSLQQMKYKTAYINTQTGNDKKELFHRFSDLQNMLEKFDSILKEIKNDPANEKYKDVYDDIMKKQRENNSMRLVLDKKLDNIYSTESAYNSSQRFLDSTIYTSVLWTILATTLVFYIFKKM